MKEIFNYIRNSFTLKFSASHDPIRVEGSENGTSRNFVDYYFFDTKLAAKINFCLKSEAQNVVAINGIFDFRTPRPLDI